MSLSLAARSSARGSAREEGARRGLPCAPLPASTSFQKKPSVFSGVFCCPPYQESVQQGLPGHFLLSVLSLPAPPSLLLGPFTRPLVREREGKKKKDYSQLHYILHHSRHLPCSSPSGWEARSPQRAGAKPTQGTRSSTLCAGATQGCARAGEGRGTSPKEPRAQARLGRRAPSASRSRGPASSG